MFKVPSRLKILTKEIDYCQIWLEKGKRYRLQIDHLNGVILTLNQRIQEIQSRPAASSVAADKYFYDPRNTFEIAGLNGMFFEDREILNRDREQLQERLRAFHPVERKLRELEREKERIFGELKRLNPAAADRIKADYARFINLEDRWIVLNEDKDYVKDGNLYLEWVLDYLRSYRDHIYTVPSDFNYQRLSGYDWVRFFSLTGIRRAKEMAHGAERYIGMVQKECICVSQLRPQAEKFPRVLMPAIDAFLEDAKTAVETGFGPGKMQRSMELAQLRLTQYHKLIEQFQDREPVMTTELKALERQRKMLYSMFVESE